MVACATTTTGNNTMSNRLDYDPTEYSSPEDAARSRVEADREFGMPRQAYSNETAAGRLANKLHHDRDAAMNDELGWHGTSRKDLAKKWGQS